MCSSSVLPVYSKHYNHLLAHLSRRIICWAYRICKPPSPRRPLFKQVIFSSETTGPIKVKFHIKLLWDGGTKVCSTGPGHLTKKAAMPIYVKNIKNSSPLEPKGWWPWNLVCSTGCSNRYQVAQMMTLGWPWPILRQGPLCFCMGKKGQTMDFFRNYCRLWFETSNRWRKWQAVSVDIKLCPLGAECSLPWGYIHVLNHEKKM